MVFVLRQKKNGARRLGNDAQDICVHLIVVVYFACAVFFMVRVNYTWTTLPYIHDMRVLHIWWLTCFSCMTWKHFMYVLVTYSGDHQCSSAGNKTVVYTIVRELFSLAPCCKKQQSSFLLCKVRLFTPHSSHISLLCWRIYEDTTLLFTLLVEQFTRKISKLCIFFTGSMLALHWLH